jgi:predicted nucleic acid-binding protein
LDAARVIRPALLDHSAWSRLNDPRLDRGRVEEMALATSDRRLLVCLTFLLEAGYSARSAADHRRVMARLLAMPRIEIDREIEARALDAQGQLAAGGHHRMPPADILLAAMADRRTIGVLHYDHDFDLITEKTDLAFESIWLAPPGAL